MTKFLQKIRRKLIDERNLKRYLIYAIGEILLVVIGILIAIQINKVNERLKNDNKEYELKNRLIEELIEVKRYNNEVFKEEVSIHLTHLESILKAGPEFDIDSFVITTEDYWAVKELSLFSYIFSFTSFYDPKFNLYKTSINDGSIYLIKDKSFSSNLDFIYYAGVTRIERLYEKEILLNQNIIKYISENYNYLFSDRTYFSNGTWDSIATKKLLREIANDGTLKILLHQKTSNLKSKILIIDEQVTPIANKVIETSKQ